MQRVNMNDIAGDIFPAGRHTRVLVGKDSPLQAAGFVMGRSSIFPGGGVPEHEHHNEEVYFIVSGSGEMTVGAETLRVNTGDAIYVSPNEPHSLKNASEGENLEMLFTYSPAGVVSHWQHEKEQG